MLTAFPQCRFSLEFQEETQSMTECVWDFKKNALWDTLQHTLNYLENHLHSEHPSEYEVHVVEILVLLAEVASQGVLCSQSYRAGTDDYHNKHVKESQVHHEMTQTPKPVIDEIRYGTI